MAQFTVDSSDIISCIDIFDEMKDAQWLIQSMHDAISNHSEKKELIEHLYFLISIYEDKIEDLIKRLDSAFEQVFPDEKPVTKLSPIQVQD
jgi:hypothetical protein